LAVADCDCRSHPCARCCWQPEVDVETAAREQLVEHAVVWSHPLCTVCHQSLPENEGMACDRCLQRTREHLAGVALMYDELPQHLSLIGSGGYDRGPRASSDGRPLPGGDVLVLLGKGSEGLDEDGLTTRDGDPMSVAYELGWWEQDWREFRDDPAPAAGPRSARAEVHSALRYLEIHSRWAATSHPGFDAFAADLRRLHARLEAATGRSARRLVAEAECFDCGGDLERKLREEDRARCGHHLPDFPPDRATPLGIRFTLEERRAWYDEQVELVEQAHGRCQQGGFEDQWTCSRCGRVYAWERYLLALQMHLRAHPAQGWSLPEHVGLTLGVSAKTVRTWANRGRVASACLIGDRRVRVWYPEVAEIVEQRRESERKAAERRAAAGREDEQRAS
jgi:hypothetical protein